MRAWRQGVEVCGGGGCGGGGSATRSGNVRCERLVEGWWKVRRRRQQGAESESGAARLEHARLGGAVDPDALQVLLRRRGLRRRNRRAHVEQQPLCALELRQQPPQASRAGSGCHARLHGLLLGASRRTLLAVRTREADGRAQFVDRAERIKDHIVLARQR